MSHPSGQHPAENFPKLPDLPPMPMPPARRAQPIPVHHGELLLTGYAIKEDVVLVLASGLTQETEVSVDGQRINVEDLHEMTTGVEGWEPMTALQLPLGTLEVGGEAFPPGMEPVQPPGMPATYAFWCRLFPRIRGC